MSEIPFEARSIYSMVRNLNSMIQIADTAGYEVVLNVDYFYIVGCANKVPTLHAGVSLPFVPPKDNQDA